MDLAPDETREILEQTAERATWRTGVDGNVAGLGIPDPGADPSAPPIDQWTTHFGWGRVNLGEAVAGSRTHGRDPAGGRDRLPRLVRAARPARPSTSTAPPRPRFATGRLIHLEARVGRGRDAGDLDDGAPAATRADGHGPRQRRPGPVRAAIAAYTPPVDSGGPTFSPTSAQPVQERVHGEADRQRPGGRRSPGVDRRVLTSVDDPDLRERFPKRHGHRRRGAAPLRRPRTATTCRS